MWGNFLHVLKLNIGAQSEVELHLFGGGQAFKHQRWSRMSDIHGISCDLCLHHPTFAETDVDVRTIDDARIRVI
jgi:hypothetical protein